MNRLTTRRAELRRVWDARDSRDSLGAIYVGWIGYNPFEDNPTVSLSDVFGMLMDCVREYSHATRTHWFDVVLPVAIESMRYRISNMQTRPADAAQDTALFFGIDDSQLMAAYRCA